MTDLKSTCDKLFELDAKRTQGAWELNDFHNKQNHYKPFYINAGEWGALAEVSGHMCTEYVDEARANAEFISSMPQAISVIREYQKREAKMVDALLLAKEWINEYRSQSEEVIPSVSDILDMEKIDKALEYLGEGE